jgi:putative protein-disulfide isomerase
MGCALARYGCPRKRYSIAMEKSNHESATLGKQGGQTINIIYYTDPLCCWSWALDKQIEQLEKEWQGAFSIRYCMGGLLPGWSQFADNQNSIMRPAQMGPLWMQAGEMLQMKIAHRIWVEDPPASSYPACIAVKCAELQSTEAGRHYLHLTREAVMEHGLNIAHREVLEVVASSVANNIKQFSFSQFIRDMENERGMDAFRKDLQEVKYRNINRFPTLVIQRPSSPGLMVTGFRPVEVLLHIINEA